MNDDNLTQLTKDEIIQLKQILAKKTTTSNLKSPIKKGHLLIFASVVLAASIFSPFSEIFPINEEESKTVKSQYLIENLRGDTIDTWKSWRLPQHTALTIAITNPNDFDQEKINILKDVITSAETLDISDSITHKGPKDSLSTYYLGWMGAALDASSQQDTLYTIPSKFDIIESGNGEGDIIITLSNLRDSDGLTGFTKSIVSDHEILKSFITIYDVDELSSEELSIIMRHEFGHALGLGHSTDPTDLMYETIDTTIPYISDCHIDALHSLYDGKESSHVECKK